MNGKDRIASVWPKWKVESVIGRGSFGTVYKAVNKSKGEESYSAIKVISIPQNEAELEELSCEGMTVDQSRTYYREMVDDLVNEIKLMESLKGTLNAVNIKDYYVEEKKGSFGWNIFIRMELLTPLNTYLCDRKLSEHDVIRLGMDICRVLKECAKKNVIHRDIKPENIFVDEFGNFKLGDFGIARKLENLTFGLSQKGTFNYMAPEMLTSSYYGANVDTYSLGIVLYKLMNGNRLPFLDASKQLLSPTERKMAVESRMKGDSMPAPRDASPEFAQIILKAAAHEPENRYESAEEMYDELEKLWNIETGDKEKADYGQSQSDGTAENLNYEIKKASGHVQWKDLLLPVFLIMAGGIIIFYAFGKWGKSDTTAVVSVNKPVSSPTSTSVSKSDIKVTGSTDEIFDKLLDYLESQQYYDAAAYFYALTTNQEWKAGLIKGATEAWREHRVVNDTCYYVTSMESYYYKQYSLYDYYNDKGQWVYSKLFYYDGSKENRICFEISFDGLPQVVYNPLTDSSIWLDNSDEFVFSSGDVFVNTEYPKQDEKFLKAVDLVKERKYNDAGVIFVELAKDYDWLRAEFDTYMLVERDAEYRSANKVYHSDYSEDFWQGPHYGFFVEYSADGEMVDIYVILFDFENCCPLGSLRFDSNGKLLIKDN